MSPSSQKNRKNENENYTDWYVDVTLKYDEVFRDEEFLFEVLDDFEKMYPVVEREEDGKTLVLSVSVEASTALKAIKKVLSTVEESTSTSNAEVLEISLRNEERRDKEINTPLIPELVSYSEIGDICGVTRQRARVLARREDFPDALAVTGQGPLYKKDAIIAWNKTRSSRPGRPKNS